MMMKTIFSITLITLLRDVGHVRAGQIGPVRVDDPAQEFQESARRRLHLRPAAAP